MLASSVTRKALRHEIIRKCTHCFGCVAAVVAAMLPLWVVAAVSAVVVMVYIFSEALRARGRRLPPITTITNLCSRPSEAKHPAFGPMALAFGFVCSFILFPPAIARSAFIVTCVSDSAAGLFGRFYGRRPIPFSQRKTVEGSLAALVCAAPVGMLYLGPIHGIIAAVTSAVIESLPMRDLDNLLMPLGTGCVLVLLGA
ncbi:MAG: phosphatidate cytidylyltransferase [Planctomycetota bacterium]